MTEAVVTVREARAGDATALAALMTELGYPTAAPAAAERLAVLAASPDDVVFVAVAPDGAVMGFVHAAERRLLVSDRFVEMEALIVTAPARRHGAAAGLADAVESWARSRGVAEVRVRARIERDDAHRFYQGRGFDLAKQQRLFVKRLCGVPGGAAAPPRLP